MPPPARAERSGADVAGLVLFPGAGAGRDQAGLVAIDDAVSARSIVVRRVDFPYRLEGRRAPDRAAVLVRTVVEAVNDLASSLAVAPERIAVGGRSMGGRMASMAVAEGLAAAALVLVSYPLHPPGHPERPRTAHLGAIAVPCLFVSGSRDAFARPEELRAAVTQVAGATSVVTLDGGDHGLKRHADAAAAVVAEWLAALGVPRATRGRPAQTG